MLELFDITHIITTYGYTGIFIIVFLESGLFFALPGDSLLFTAGLFASAGILSIFKLLPLIFIATFLGGILGYFVGMHLERLHRYSFFRRILKQEYIDKADVFFKKYGKLTIMFSRFVPIVRTFAPIVAGMVRMPYMTFIKVSLFSSLVWTVFMTGVGYLLGHFIPGIKDYLSIFIFSLIGLSMLPIIFEFIKGKKVN